MSTHRTKLEIIAPSIDEAVAQGLADLGLTRESVEIEVLDEGSRGLFGLGTRQARIRMTVKGTTEDAEDVTVQETDEEIMVIEAEGAEEPTELAADEEDPAITKSTSSRYEEVQQEVTLDICKATVAELIERMGITCEVSAKFGEMDDHSGITPVMVDVQGNDLSVLIGKRSETLNALQFIARQIVNKELGRNVTLVIDVEGYRERREKQLRQLARRMADQAIKTGRKQVLEPMSPNERRIIHMELRENPDVTTQSFGEEPHRKVTILPNE
jgi:spoIIIJ-associated protein